MNLIDDDNWDELDLGDGKTVQLPAEERADFRDHVDVLAVASDAWSSIGPMVHERHQYICRFDDLYLVRTESDWGYSTVVVGRFGSRQAGVAACIDRSEAFVPDLAGDACSAWSDEDDDGDIDEREVWDPSEDGSEGDDSEANSHVVRGMSCLRLPGHSGRPPQRYRTLEPIISQAERRENRDELLRTSIVHRDLTIAGEDAVDELPANRKWHVVPCDSEQRCHLERVLGQVELATVDIDGRSFMAAFTDRMAPTTAARVGAAFGAERIWELDRDSIRTVEPGTPCIIAEGLRIR